MFNAFEFNAGEFNGTIIDLIIDHLKPFPIVYIQQRAPKLSSSPSTKVARDTIKSVKPRIVQ